MKLSSLSSLSSLSATQKTLLECEKTGIVSLLILPCISSDFPSLSYAHPLSLYKNAKDFANLPLEKLELLSDDILAGLALSFLHNFSLLENNKNSGIENNLLLQSAGTLALSYFVKALSRIKSQDRAAVLPSFSLNITTINTKNNKNESGVYHLVKTYTEIINNHYAPSSFLSERKQEEQKKKNLESAPQSDFLKMKILSITRKDSSGKNASQQPKVTQRGLEESFQFNKKKGKVLLEKAIAAEQLSKDSSLAKFLTILFQKRNLASLGKEKRAELISKLEEKGLSDLAHVIEVSYNPFDAIFSVTEDDLDMVSFDSDVRKVGKKFSLKELLEQKASVAAQQENDNSAQQNDPDEL